MIAEWYTIMTVRKYTLSIDESGTLPDPKDKVIVIAAIIPEYESILEDVLKEIKHVDSKINKKVNIADMIAGAVFANETDKNKAFYKIIEGKIINYQKLNWIEAKKRLFEK
jgi:hypothetical protein